jgi:hypothetical protein
VKPLAAAIAVSDSSLFADSIRLARSTRRRQMSA